MKRKIIIFISMLIIPTNAYAVMDWVNININTNPISNGTVLVILPLATMWGYRKVIKTINRS